jgi:hypothetical protein
MFWVTQTLFAVLRGLEREKHDSRFETGSSKNARMKDEAWRDAIEKIAPFEV